MPVFGERSEDRLATIDSRLRLICKEAIKSYDFTVLVGHRGKEEQDKAFASGASKLKWPDSKHNKTPSLAVDLAPFPIDWNDIKRFYYLAGIMKAEAKNLGYKIRWGGDWDGDGDFKDQTFNDLVHFEIVEI